MKLKDFIYKNLIIKVITYIKELLKALKAEIYNNYYKLITYKALLIPLLFI